MIIKTSELLGAALDWAVAGAEGNYSLYCDCGYGLVWSPSTDWSQGGPIIDREKIDTEGHWNVMGCGVRTSFKEWCATHPKNHGGLIRYTGYGPTRLIAAMRCYVASKLGNVVDIPKSVVDIPKSVV